MKRYLILRGACLHHNTSSQQQSKEHMECKTLCKPSKLNPSPWRQQGTCWPDESFQVLHRSQVWKLQVLQNFLKLLFLQTRDAFVDDCCAHSQGPGDNSVPSDATLATPSKDTKARTTGLSFSFTSFFHASSY